MKHFVTPACCPCFCWRCFFGGERGRFGLALKELGDLVVVSQGWFAPAPRHGSNTGGSPTGKAGGRGHVEAGGRRLLEVGGWRHGARGGCTGHAAIFPRWTRGERARPLAWNLREVTQWTKIQPPAAASSPPAAAVPGRRACSEGSSTPQPRRGDLHSARFGFGFPIALPAAGSWQGKEAMPTGWPRAGDAIQRAAPCIVFLG